MKRVILCAPIVVVALGCGAEGRVRQGGSVATPAPEPGDDETGVQGEGAPPARGSAGPAGHARSSELRPPEPEFSEGESSEGPPPAAPSSPQTGAPARRQPLPCPDVLPPDMACVGGGWFARGSEDEANEGPVEEIFVETFLMDLREVANADYRACVEAGVCEPAFPYRGFGGPRQPVVAVRWTDADAFCRWRDRRLPTEAEWERAARGPDNTRFPWGDDPTDACARAHVRDARGHGCGTETTRDVGTLPPGHWGLFDMAGNVDEWTADWYAPCYRGCRRECGDACAGEEPRGPCDGAPDCERRLRVVRGGSWWWPISHATGTFRRGKPPANQAHHRYGFRCARSLGGP